MPPDAGAHTAPPVHHHGWRIPFWALQVLELGVAFLLVTQAVHVVRGGVLVAGGLVLAVLAVTADGPLGIFRVCGRRLHRTLVLVIAGALAACCLVPAVRPDVEGLLVIAFAVVALVVLASRTTVSGGRGRRRGRRPSAGRNEVIDATATVTPVGPVAPVPPTPPSVADTAARKAGRATAAAGAVGKKAVDDHRPQVEEQVKKTIRGAGRLAGKLAAPRTPPDAGRS